MNIGDFNKLLNTMTALFYYNSMPDQRSKSRLNEIAAKFGVLLGDFLNSYPNHWRQGRVIVLSVSMLGSITTYYSLYERIMAMHHEHERLSNLCPEIGNARMAVIESEIQTEGRCLVSLWTDELAQIFKEQAWSCQNEPVNELMRVYFEKQMNRTRTSNLVDPPNLGHVDMNKQVYGTIQACDEIELGVATDWYYEGTDKNGQI